MRIAMRPKVKNEMKKNKYQFVTFSFFQEGKFVINICKEKLAKAGVSTLKLTSLTFPAAAIHSVNLVTPNFEEEKTLDWFSSDLFWAHLSVTERIVQILINHQRLAMF